MSGPSRAAPTIAIVVGKKAMLIVDDGLGTPSGKIVLDAARKLSTNGQKLYLTTTHYHAEHATGDGAFPPDTILIRPRAQQAELESEGQKLIDIFAGRSPEDKELLQGMRVSEARHPVRYRLPAGSWRGESAPVLVRPGAHARR